MKNTRATDFDVILWGATGFTGRLVAEYLARTQGSHGARWALAGRDRGKLEQVRAGLAAIEPRCAELPLLVGDAKDAASLEAMVGRTRVVCTTVGPYARYGSELVAACARQGVDYCDLTGEVQWMRRMIDAYHERAKETGARIVHTCGFDSIPSDLGVLMMQEHMREHHGGHCSRIQLFVGASRGGASGGTIASALHMSEEMERDRSVRRVVGDPYALDPQPRQGGPDGRDQMGVRYSPEMGRWTAPWFMASVNTRVVRRSHALLGYPWGRDFRYSEVLSLEAGPAGFLKAVGVTASMGAALGLMGVGPIRRLLAEKVLPKPGEGPSAEAREKGFFKLYLVGEGESPRLGRPVRLEGRVFGKGDPGYAATARMLAESALCLAFDELPAQGGVLTPATVMGMKLVQRLRKTDFTFEVEER